jgi:hypothetical protein
MTNGKLASLSWYQAQSGAQDRIFVTVKQLGLLMWGILSDGSMGLSFTTAGGPRYSSHSRV